MFSMSISAMKFPACAVRVARRLPAANRHARATLMVSLPLPPDGS